jgi:glycosyltransferase involved in cell wall biosynthesis
VGHLYRGRGVELILALARLIPEADFHIVGGETADIARVSADCPSNLTVHGYVAPADLGSHFAEADICLAPYEEKVRVAGNAGNTATFMSPLKIFEYMSHGKTIIASNLPSICEILTDEKDALLRPPEDTSAWHEALRQLIHDRNLRERLGAAAKRRFLDQFTWKKRAERILHNAAEYIAKPPG